MDVIQQLNIIQKTIEDFLRKYERNMNTDKATDLLNELEQNRGYKKAIGWVCDYGVNTPSYSLEIQRNKFKPMINFIDTEILPNINPRFNQNHFNIALDGFYNLCILLGIERNEKPKMKSSNETKRKK